MLVYDLDGLPHDKQPIDAKECVERLGWSYSPPGPIAITEFEPEKPKSTKK